MQYLGYRVVIMGQGSLKQKEYSWQVGLLQNKFCAERKLYFREKHLDFCNFAYYVVTSALKHLFPVLLQRFVRINFCNGRNYVMISLTAFIFHEVFIGRWIQLDDLSTTCSIHWGGDCKKFKSGIMKGRDSLGYLKVDGKIGLNWEL
jgi:hypothetical protein